MTPSLAPASSVRPGDLMECSGKVWKPVRAIDPWGELIFFIFEDAIDTRAARVGDWVCVGRAA